MALGGGYLHVIGQHAQPPTPRFTVDIVRGGDMLGAAQKMIRRTERGVVMLFIEDKRRVAAAAQQLRGALGEGRVVTIHGEDPDI